MVKKLGNYTVIEEIGRGGMAVVYRAVQESLNRIVAIKELDLARFRGEPSALERFRLEARTAASLEHPNIVTIYDLWEENDKAFIAMEFVDGAELKEVLVSLGTLEPVEAALIVIEICGALSFAHSKGMIHRDIKPANIMLSASGEVKLMDFGIVSVPDSGELTMAGQILGTPAYMAPEQITGEQVGPAADIFSLGAVLYKALTGAKPFTAANHIALIQKVLHSDPVPPGQVVPGISNAMSQLVLKCLSKNADTRYGSMQELSTVLEMSLPLERLTRRDSVARLVARHRDPDSTALRTPSAGPEDMTAPFAVADLHDKEPHTATPPEPVPAHPLEMDSPADLPPLEPVKDKLSVPKTYQDQAAVKTPLELRDKSGQEDAVDSGSYVDDRKSIGIGAKIVMAIVILLVLAAGGAWFFLDMGSRVDRKDVITERVQLGQGAQLIVISEFGGEVFINGKKHGAIDSAATFDIDPGFHSLEVEHPEYGSKKYILELEPGARERLVVEFEVR
jgi:serine/threonine-protein kinase